MLPELASLAMKNYASNAMASFAAVELRQRSPAFGSVIDLGQRMQGLFDATELCNCLSQSGRPLTYLKRSHRARANTRPSLSEPARRSMSSQCGFYLLQANILSRCRIEHPVICLLVNAPEACPADIGQT
jgi:hypothetical protein